MSSISGSRSMVSAYDSPTFGEDSSFHVEQPVGSMSISPCGRDVVLASKEGLHIIDLDNPYSPPRYLPHRTPWEVADVQWSPFASRDSWVASTSNQKALVWNLAMKTGQSSIEHVLHAHSRAITDINFSAHHPDIIATCAVDSFVHCWDLRVPARPVVSFSDWFSGATQVKWNRQDSHVIASSHDRFLRIWDDRMGAYPIRTIEAHNTKIYGLDWNRIRPEAIVTCSLDKTIKFWDYSQENDVPEKVIHAPFPVWRTRHTPFGWGVLAMPQRGNSDLHLYSRSSKSTTDDVHDDLPLVHSFPGHKGQVKEFLWRPRGSVMDDLDHREFQLVSWGTDRELRLHRVDPEILREVGYEKGKSFNPLLNLTRSGAVYKTYRDETSDTDDCGHPPQGDYHAASTGMNGISGAPMPYSRGWIQGRPIGQTIGQQTRPALRADMNPISWMRGVKISGWETETLGDEITHVGEKFTRVVFESVNVGQRKATISMHGPWGPDNSSVFLKIDIKFPLDYPRAAAPIFEVQRTAAVTKQLARTITSGIHDIAHSYISKKRGCLEGVLRYLLGEHSVEESVSIVQTESSEPLKSPEMLGDDESSDEDGEVGQFQDSDLALSSSELLRPINANVMVPVARECGALWTNDGRLVCFFPRKEEKEASFLDPASLRAMTGLSRNDKVFEGFGRLQPGSSGPRGGVGTGLSGGLTTDDGASDYSDESSYESSSSSGSSDLLGSLPQQFQGTHTWRHNNIGFHGARSMDNSQRSATGAGTVKSSSGKPQNSIRIYDFEDLLPAKKSLAKQYQIFGDRAEVCSYNGKVAAKSGHSDLAYIWGLVSLMLQSHVPAQITKGGDGALVAALAARRASGHGKRKDSEANLVNGDIKKRSSAWTSPPLGKIKWGEHPLGSRWFIPALFEHFERLGDVQMLGMLSCILYEPESKQASPDDRLKFSTSSFLLQDNAFSDDRPHGRYTDRGQPQFGVSFASKDARNIAASHSSGCSSVDQWHGVTPPLHSTGTTPPTGIRGSRLNIERKPHRYITSLAGSPDQHPNTRFTSNLGTTLASSLSRSLTFGPSASSSPPNGSGKRQTSPSGSLNNALSNAWAYSRGVGKSRSAIPDYLAPSAAATPQTYSDTESEKPASLKSTRVSDGVKVVFRNQGSFDNDSHADVPLLDPQQQSFYQAYRANYANLLFIWGMPIEQNEVLRLSAIVDNQRDFHMPSHYGNKPRFMRNRRDNKFGGPAAQGTQLESETHNVGLQRHCSKCGFALQVSAFTKPATGPKPSDKNNNKLTLPLGAQCPRCKPAQPTLSNLPCVICSEMIKGIFSPCLACGHITCFDCHNQWFGPTPAPCSNGTSIDNSTQTRSCPTGCGCNCSEKPIIGMPMPPPPLSGLSSRPASASRRRNLSRNKPHTPDNRHHSRNKLSRGGTHLGFTHHTDEIPDSYLDEMTIPLARGRSTGLNFEGQHSIINMKTASGVNSGPIMKAAGLGGTRSPLERIDTM